MKACPPEQGHLALLEAGLRGVSVTWVQKASKSGYVNTALRMTATKSVLATVKIHIQDMCGSPANETNGSLNRVIYCMLRLQIDRRRVTITVSVATIHTGFHLSTIFTMAQRATQAQLSLAMEIWVPPQ